MGIVTVMAHEDRNDTESPSANLCRRVSERSGGVCLLAFSRGKDSVGAWLQCRRYFARIIPFHCYLVPGMAFERESLDYFAGWFGVPILDMPHPSVSRYLAWQVFSSPADNRRWDTLAEHTYQDVYMHVAATAGVSVLTPCAVGVRSADSIHRRKAIMATGGENKGKGEFYPCHDWDADRLESEITTAGVQLPVDYQWWGRSFDGLDARFTASLRRNAPEDYARLRRLYPLAYGDECRMKWRAKHAGH
jgi:hypothetical protein